MFALLQVYSLQCSSSSGDEIDDLVDVIAVDASEERLERFLEDYRERHRRAAAELEERLEALGDDWQAAQEQLHDEIADKYRVHGSLIPEPDIDFWIEEVHATLDDDDQQALGDAA
jgi:hypothetical protein